MKGLYVDERTIGITGKIAAIWLPLTQLGLLAAILYRAYVLQQADSQLNDLRIILGVSVFGHIGTLLFLGGFFPALKIRTLLVVYLALVLLLFTVLSIWLGLPSLDNWANTILPVLVGPAILVGLYGGLAYLGQKRIERDIG
jgi:hypothetical protein